MKRIVLLILLIFVCFSIFSIPNVDSLLNILNEELSKKDLYLQQKFQKIDALVHKMSDSKYEKDLNNKFEIDLKLYNEYKSFIYDSAFSYALKVQQSAIKIDDPGKIAISKINFGFILISSGMFKEAFDTLKSMNKSNLPDSILREYYSLKARAYLDLISYDLNGFYSPKYIVLLNQNADSAINLCSKNSEPYLQLLSLKAMGNGNFDQALPIFEELLHQFKLDLHQYAMASSGLAYVYLNKGQVGKAMDLLAEAVKADLRSSTKETMAARKLAEILFEQGNLTEAHRYIKLAMDDATFYKTYLRQKQISMIMPSIEGKELNYMESQKKRLLRYSLAITGLSILVIIFLWLIYKQLKELKKAKKTILESNKIKDEYIGYYFNIISEYIDKIDRFKKAIDRKILTKKIEDIEVIINNIDPRKEKEDLYVSFDKVFLKLFPDFVIRYNAMFKEEDRVILKQNQLLTTDLRIFAFIRLGITDNEKIAKILNYSVHTIYAYKTKIKNKAIVPNEQFEQKIMEIETI